MRHVQPPLEFKDANGDGEPNEVKDALALLTKSTTDALAKVADDVKKITARQDDIEKKANRARLSGGGGDENKGDRDAEHKALGLFVKAGDDTELKAMSVGSDPDGGYFVVPVLAATMIKRMFDQSPMRRLARVITLTTGDAWEEPVDKNDTDATWVGETASRPATATAQVGVLRVPLNEIYALQPCTQKLLDTSYINIGAWIEGKIADKFGRSEGLACVSGDGVLKPRGFLTYDTATDGDSTRASAALQHVVSGSATTITADALRDLYWTLRAPHHANASWLMASATANVIDKLKDGNGDYLWRDSSAAGMAPTLLGRPVEFSEDMPSVGAGALAIAFADWQQGYLIVDRAGIKFLQDPYTSKPNVLFYAYRRTGGSVANTDAIKLLKISA